MAKTKWDWSGAASAKEAIESLHKAFRLLTKSGLNTTQAVERIRAEVPECPEVCDLLAFMERSERGFVK